MLLILEVNKLFKVKAPLAGEDMDNRTEGSESCLFRFYNILKLVGRITLGEAESSSKTMAFCTGVFRLGHNSLRQDSASLTLMYYCS